LEYRVTIIGVVRLVTLIQAYYFIHVSNHPTAPKPSVAFTISAIETNVAILTASVPALKPLFRRWFPRLLSGGGMETYEYNPYATGTDRYSGLSRPRGLGNEGRDNGSEREFRGWRDSGMEMDGRSKGGSEGDVVRVTSANLNMRYRERSGERERDSE
jgi:hypothetical protein